MGKFLALIKNWIGSFRSGESSGPAGAPDYGASNPKQREIEMAIDSIVEREIGFCMHLWTLVPEIKYWQSVFKALAFAESNFKLNCRYVEPPSLGKDAVTGKQNTSEGLLQLSYQDSRFHGCSFDWDSDKNKNAFDLSKSIFDIQKNITCGLMIMNKLVGKKGHYVFNDGNYWAVLKPKNKRHEVFIKKFNQYQGG